MADWWVDDGGDDSAGTSWATAYVSFASLVSHQATALTTAGNRIFVGDDHNDPTTGGARTLVGPTGLSPVILISADRTDNAAVPAYKVGTGKQVDTTDVAQSITLDGAFACYGMRFASGLHINVNPDSAQCGLMVACKFVLGLNGALTMSSAYSRIHYRNCVVDLSADTSNQSTSVLNASSVGYLEAHGFTFVNPQYRTGSIVACDGIGYSLFSGCDFSGFTNGTLCETSQKGANLTFSNCKLPSLPSVDGGSDRSCQFINFVNCYSADAPEALGLWTSSGRVLSSGPYETAVTRSSGATVEGTAVAWKMVSNSSTSCHEYAPLFTPWIYGVLDSTGAKNFDVYVANNVADLYDDEAWLEVEFLGTANSPLTSYATDHRTITATHSTSPNSVSRDDTGSTWNGATLGNPQRFRVTATVGEEGIFRARVALAKASTTLYVDPQITVT